MTLRLCCVAAVSLACWWAAAEEPVRVVIDDDLPPGLPSVAEVVQATHGPKHHFFGYYGISPWNASGKYLVCLQTDQGRGKVEPGDRATIALLELASGDLRPLTTTRAWNFQQGTMLHWMGTDPERLITFNDRRDGMLAGIVRDVFNGEERMLPRPIAALAPNGKLAASLNYDRLNETRPGYGYGGDVEAARLGETAPGDDGLYIMDCATDEVKLIVSYADAIAAEPLPSGYNGSPIWFNHVLFSRDSERIFFLARFRGDARQLVTAAFTVDVDGANLRCIIPYAWGASHFDWGPDRQMVITTRYQGASNWLHVVFTDGASRDQYQVLRDDVLGRDGHCTFSPTGTWLVTDSYPYSPERLQDLYLVNMDSREASRAAAFYQPREFHGPWRCDLHPRWSPDGTQICIDSTHGGMRQVYIVKLNLPAQ